jgi:hypothetical protein
MAVSCLKFFLFFGKKPVKTPVFRRPLAAVLTGSENLTGWLDGLDGWRKPGASDRFRASSGGFKIDVSQQRI